MIDQIFSAIAHFVNRRPKFVVALIGIIFIIALIRMTMITMATPAKSRGGGMPSV